MTPPEAGHAGEEAARPPRQRYFGDDVEDGEVCGFCGVSEPCEHGPGRYPPNDVGHRCRSDSVVDGVCIDCERSPHIGSSAEPGS